uniref:Uncharacterized protein n=1 Tax=Cacopsylla melanoneura TaxID=428564 RepID=A0A8D8Z1N8_9HEMI
MNVLLSLPTDGDCFKYLVVKFPSLSKTKWKQLSLSRYITTFVKKRDVLGQNGVHFRIQRIKILVDQFELSKQISKNENLQTRVFIVISSIQLILYFRPWTFLLVLWFYL